MLAISGVPSVELSVTGGITRFMRREAQDLTPDIQLRELLDNALAEGATKVNYHIIWPRVESKGIYDLMITDNGNGMSADIMKTLGSVLGGANTSSKSADAFTGNWNWGMRLTCLAIAQHVVAVSTQVIDGVVTTNLAWLASNGTLAMKTWTYDPGDGYDTTVKVIPGHHFQAAFKDVIEDAGFDPVAEHLTALKMMKSKQGTTIFLVESAKHGHTYLGSHGYNRGGTRGNDGNLNKRLWTVPEGVKINMTEFHAIDPDVWPKQAGTLSNAAVPATDDTCSWQVNRGVYGAKRFIIEGDPVDNWVGGDGNELHITDGQLAGTTIWWALRKNKHATGGRAPYNDQGYIAMLHKNELFHHQRGITKYRACGITEKSVRDQLYIIVEPPVRTTADGSGAKMNAKRTGLEWAVDGVPQPHEHIYDVALQYFRDHMPLEVLAAQVAARGGDELDDGDDSAARQRFIERFNAKFKRSRLRKAATGSRRTVGGDPGGTPNEGVSPTPENRPNLPGGGNGGMGGNPDYGPEGGTHTAEEIKAAGDLPNFSTKKTEWDKDWTIAMYNHNPAQGEERTIYLNVSHPFVEAYTEWWIEDSNVLGWEDGETAVKKLVYESYRDILWGVVALARDYRSLGLTEDEVADQFLSDMSLTAACTGNAHLDALIGSRKGPTLAKLGARPTLTVAAV